MEDTYLAHYGLKGMKWGTRRWQDDEGHFNEAGYERYFGGHKRRPVASGKISRTHARRDNEATNDRTIATNGRGTLSRTATVKLTSTEKKITKQQKTSGHELSRNTSMSDVTLEDEMAHSKNMKKAILLGVGVVGITSAVYLAYRTGCISDLEHALASKTPITPDMVSHIMHKNLTGIEYTIKEGDVIHRMVGFANYNLSETAGKATYVSVLNSDRAGYALFLKDWAGTGERYDVALKAQKDIKIPTKATAEQIFDRFYKANPTYKDELVKTLTDTYMSFNPGVSRDKIKDYVVDMIEKDPFGKGIYSLVRQGADSKMLMSEYRRAGYDAIVDYFDTGKMSKMPVILFDAEGSLTKVGERKVDEMSKRLFAQVLATDASHPLHERGVEWIVRHKQA